jgi:hypothetical protein
MSVLECVLWFVSIEFRGEEYFGNPDAYEEQQDQQQFVNQGKYSMGLP